MSNADHAEAPQSSTSDLIAEPQLNAVEGRILASLFEKAATTPDQYPLTVNALQLACNQKNNRDPLMQLEQGEIVHALRQLETRSWARQSSEGVRAQRWEHRFDARLGLTPRKAAVLCTLLLRGPQTLNEIHTRGERLAAFPESADVQDTLERLIEREPLSSLLSVPSRRPFRKAVLRALTIYELEASYLCRLKACINK